jgi:uncharacterized protein (TIGR03435 family)
MLPVIQPRPTVAVVLCALLLPASVIAQTVQAAADSPVPRFDVASVKPGAGPPGPPLIDGRQFRNSGRALVTNMSLLAMIQVLFRMNDPAMLIEGGPAWLGVDRFDIEARGEPGSDAATSPGQPLPRMNEMLKALLAERFSLRTHVERRPMQIYALAPADPAHPTAKLHVSATADCAAAQNDPDRRCGIRQVGATGITAVGVALGQLALTLSGIGRFVGLDRPVENRTGIEGRFDINVMDDLASGPAVEQGGRQGTPPGGPEQGARFMTMLKEQLGLVLRSVPGERDVLIIDRAEHPTPN